MGVSSWKGVMRRVTQILIVLVAASWAAFVMVVSLQCQPLSLYWDQSIDPGDRCIDEDAFFHGQCMPSFVIDLVIMDLPLKTIWGLQLPMIKRVALVFIFMIASL